MNSDLEYSYNMLHHLLRYFHHLFVYLLSVYHPFQCVHIKLNLHFFVIKDGFCDKSTMFSDCKLEFNYDQLKREIDLKVMVEEQNSSHCLKMSNKKHVTRNVDVSFFHYFSNIFFSMDL